MKKNNNSLVAVLSVLCAVLLIISGLLFWVYRNAQMNLEKILNNQKVADNLISTPIIPNETVHITPSTTENSDITNELPAATESQVGFDEFGKFKLIAGNTDNSFYFKDYSENFQSGDIKITWTKYHDKLSTSTRDAILGKITSEKEYQDYCRSKGSGTFCSDLNFEIAGKITKGAGIVGMELFYLVIPGEMGPDIRLAMFYDEKTNRFIYFKIKDNEYLYFDRGSESIFGGFIDVGSFKELTVPEVIDLSGSKAILKYNFRLGGSFFGDIYITKDKPYTQSDVIFTSSKYGPIYYRDSAFHLIMPNGIDAAYDIFPDFLVSSAPVDAKKDVYGPSYEAKISWLNGRIETDSFVPSTEVSTGCGGPAFADSGNVGNKEWFDESKLVEVGLTSDGQSIYELDTFGFSLPEQVNWEKDSAYVRLFNIGYYSAVSSTDSVVNGSKLLIQEQDDFNNFLQDHPIFFWKDQFGHWHMYHKAKYRSVAECGKPVIYLYPEKTSDVRVQVNPNGGFTKTEPAYGENGWLVRATPNSELYNYADKTTYPYLFWEGHGYNYEWSKNGFVLKKEEVATKVPQALAGLGLNEKEIKDFMEFWQDKLMKGNYVKVIFVPQIVFNTLAPLKVEPRPNTVIRVFMDYELSDKREISEAESFDSYISKITTPARKGFAVVEWGGVLHK